MKKIATTATKASPNSTRTAARPGKTEKVDKTDKSEKAARPVRPGGAARPAGTAPGKADKGQAPAAVTLLAKRVDFEAFLSKLGAKDRQNIEKHVAALEAEPDGKHLKLWKRMVIALATLAPHAAQTNGQQSIQFYIPDGADGRYRKQVFAIEDLRDGKVTVYVSDVLDKVLAGGALEAPARGSDDEEAGPRLFGIAASGSQHLALSLEPLDSVNTPDPPAFYKHMLGWNRKALRIVLPNDAAPAQINAAEEICATAAREWNP